MVLQIEYERWSAIGHYMRDGESEYGSPKIRNCKTKREGWVNVYRGGMVSHAHKTESRAKDAASSDVLATIKIEWEE